MRSRPPSSRARWSSAAFGLALLLGFTAPAPAQTVRPWTPPDADSLVVWAAAARAGFQEAKGDSVTGSNLRAYELVSRIGRRLLGALGRENMAQAGAAQAVFDSLGLSAEVVTDPGSPSFVLLMVRNPWRLTAEGVGFLYWWRQRELRMQGVQFRATMEPRARVWWTGQAARPYQWAVVTRQRGELPLRFLTLLDLNSGGTFWTTTQYPDGGGDLGLADDVAFPDVNADGRPELMTWGAAPEDSLFEQCRGCPRLLRERLWVERDGLFDAWDERLMPTPFSTFALFVRLLRQQNRAAASRLLADPARYDAAVREGWASGTARRSWKLEYSEPDQPWPTWLAFRHQGAAGKPLYVVHFVMKDGRWLIRDWIRPAPAGADTTRRPAPAAAGTKRP